jgi:outer membrane lipoprotein LolB
MMSTAGAVRALPAIAAALWLAACATLPAVQEAERTHAGRFAATTSLDGRSENTTGRFTLSVSGPRLVLDLASPLGTTMARIESGPDGALMRAPGSDGLQDARGRDAEALALQVLGWPLPVAGIGDWIVGRPAPARPSRTQGNDGRLQTIEQDGWTIEIAERFDTGEPRRLVFVRPARPGNALTPAAPAITLRLVLDEPAPLATER